MFRKDLFSKGIIAIGDLLSDAGIFLKGVKVLNVNLSAIEYFSLISIVDAIPVAINDQTKHVTRSSLYEWYNLFELGQSWDNSVKGLIQISI